MDMKKCYKKNSSFVFRMIDDEALLVPMVKTTEEVDCIYTLSPLAAWIWEKIDGKTNVEKIKKMIIQEYAVAETTAEKDLNDFIAQLEEIESIK
ncbi:MAG: PqqD family protein [Candidatus Omnitrophica bacterium]|nr:PqqD family protein [Candidatus Omnitrophota bacterium]